MTYRSFKEERTNLKIGLLMTYFGVRTAKEGIFYSSASGKFQ